MYLCFIILSLKLYWISLTDPYFNQTNPESKRIQNLLSYVESTLQRGNLVSAIGNHLASRQFRVFESHLAIAFFCFSFFSFFFLLFYGCYIDNQDKKIRCIFLDWDPASFNMWYNKHQNSLLFSSLKTHTSNYCWFKIFTLWHSCCWVKHQNYVSV